MIKSIKRVKRFMEINDSSESYYKVKKKIQDGGVVLSEIKKVDSIWLAAAAITYLRYKRGQIKKIEDVFIKQSDIVAMAEMIVGEEVPATLASRQCSVNNEYTVYHYLIPGENGMEKMRRLSFPGEFENVKEMPVMDFSIKVSMDEEEIEASEIVRFVRTEYAKVLKEQQTAITPTGEAETIEKGGLKERSDMSKNIILYGPPGTGKTYHSVNYAVSIIERQPFTIIESENHNDVLARFNKYKESGQVAFTTFHQSYGYEEFIEGIKPKLDDSSDDVTYSIEAGVFKKFCTNAEKPEIRSTEFELNPHARIWKITIQDGSMNEIKKQCFKDQNVRIGFGKDAQESKVFINSIEKGDVVISLKKRTTIDAIGIVMSEEAYELEGVDRYSLCRDVTWLATNIDVDICGINGGKILNRPTVCGVPNMTVEDIIEVAKKMNPALTQTAVTSNDKPYVFIIDEINRGNISKIFGELITLIEDTKRIGKKEAMRAILPYSGEAFGVPENVYILGTMNTADRSIALMDTALRRRFQFVEMMPDSKVIKEIEIHVRGDILNISDMLDVINERIEYLFDREHTIGHAFFIGLKTKPTINRLAEIFKKSIIPLLQEYFYEDYGKIQLVLGDNLKTSNEYKFILDEPIKAKEIFNGNPDIDLPEKKYKIQDTAFYNIRSYKEISSKL